MLQVQGVGGRYVCMCVCVLGCISVYSCVCACISVRVLVCVDKFEVIR